MPNYIEVFKYNINLRDNFIKELVKWLRVPYKHMGNSPLVGTDCGTFIAIAMKKCNIISKINIPYYSPTWYYTYKKSLILDLLYYHITNYSKYFLKKIINKELLLGDFLCFNIFSKRGLVDHLGIYIANDKFIHCGKYGVKISNLNNKWNKYLKFTLRLCEKVEE